MTAQEARTVIRKFNLDYAASANFGDTATTMQWEPLLEAAETLALENEYLELKLYGPGRYQRADDRD